MRLIIDFPLALVLLSLGIANGTSAGDCRGPGLREEFKINKLVFVARAISKSKDSASFKIQSLFKGKIDKNFDFYNSSPRTAGEETAESFDVGQSYFFSTNKESYVEDGKTRLTPHACDNIAPIGNISEADLDWLKMQANQSSNKVQKKSNKK
jgi:hypothetical protein